MIFSWSKKPPFKRKTSSNDKTTVSFTEKEAQKIFRIFDLNHSLTPGLTPLKIWEFFDRRKM